VAGSGFAGKQYMDYIYCADNGYFVATDGICLVAIHYTETLIDQLQYVKMRDKFISKEDWKMLVTECSAIYYINKTHISAYNIKNGERKVKITLRKPKSIYKGPWSKLNGIMMWEKILIPSCGLYAESAQIIGLREPVIRQVYQVFKSMDKGLFMQFHFSSRNTTSTHML
jgi:hypothetical protein